MIHADYLSYEVKKKAVEDAEEPPMKSARFEECLVCYTAFEKGDTERHVNEAVREIKEVVARVKAENVVLYPWVHLTTNPLGFKEAKKLFNRLYEETSKSGLETYSVPIGWYKMFEIKCKGHPLAETMREIKLKAKEEAKEAVEKGYFIILHPDGGIDRVARENVDNLEGDIRQIMYDELGLLEPAGKPPPHIELMRRLEMVDYEPASDVGHFRFYPKGAFVKGMIESLAEMVSEKIGALRIETPFFYRLDVEAIRSQAEKFRERNYLIKLDSKELIVRFAGDFGLFEMLKDATISYRNLPLRMYEISPSFRLEQRGECVGLRRLRSFTMPDIHCLTKDLEQGMEEYKMLFKMFSDLLKNLQIDYVVVFRIVEDYLDKFKPDLIEMLSYIGKPAIIEVLPEMKHYWVLKHEFQFIDAIGGHAQLSTVQLDIEDSERYGIAYQDRDGSTKGTIIVHSSIGSIERFIYALLEKAAKDSMKGLKPMLPLWISPVQVRLVPVSADNIEYALKIAEKLTENRVRAEVDDRDLRLAKKIAEAETDWIPYICVIGKKEIEKNTLMVRRREDDRNLEMSLEELIEEIKTKTKGMPYKPIPVPVRMSKQPVFTG